MAKESSNKKERLDAASRSTPEPQLTRRGWIAGSVQEARLNMDGSR